MSRAVYIGHKSHHLGVYVGRPSELGNSFPRRQYGLSSCLALYEKWLDETRPAMLARLVEQFQAKGSLTLLCYCWPVLVEYRPDLPLRCHAQIIAAKILAATTP